LATKRQDDVGFEVFRKEFARNGEPPTVSIYAAGKIVFNFQAVKLLGDPEAVLLGFDRERRMIGITVCAPDDPDGFKVLSFKSQRPILREVSCERFLRYFDIRHAEAKRYPLRQEGERLVIPLDEATAARHGRPRGLPTNPAPQPPKAAEAPAEPPLRVVPDPPGPSTRCPRCKEQISLTKAQVESPRERQAVLADHMREDCSGLRAAR
jgi:hypothetical protein